MTWIRWALLTLVMLLPGCGATVYPPASPVDPVTVYLADHGIHSSLFIPIAPTVSNSDDSEIPTPRLMQYAYTQFKWAALDYDQWYRGPFALMVPADGAIGLREWEGATEARHVKEAYDRAGIAPSIEKVYPIVVERAAAAALRDRLRARWEEGEKTKVFNEKRGLWFVRDPAKYSLFHNCNTEVSEWLRELGCEVSGKAVSADFTVKEPR